MSRKAICRTLQSHCTTWRLLIVLCWIAGCTSSETVSNRTPDAQTDVGAGEVGQIDLLPIAKSGSENADDLRKVYEVSRIATFYEAIGDFQKSLQKWQQAREVVSKDFAEYAWLHKSIDVQILRMKRAIHFSDPERVLSSRLLQARSALKESVAVMDRDAVARDAAVVRELTAELWGSEDAAYVDYLVGLAESHLLIKDFAQAEKAAREARAIQERVFGTENSLYADVVELLGSIELEREDYVAAKRLFMRSREIKDT